MHRSTSSYRSVLHRVLRGPRLHQARMLLPAVLALLLTLSLSVHGRWKDWIAADAQNDTPVAVVPSSEPTSNPTGASALCDTPEPNTLLIPVAAQPGGASPRDIRIHYRRDDGRYDTWGLHLWLVDDDGRYVADYPGVNWNAPLQRSGIDAYGAYFDLPAAALSHPSATGLGFIVHPPGGAGDPGGDRLWRFTDGGEFWLRSGDATTWRRDPGTAAPSLHTVRVHYRRFDGQYARWGLHLWPGSGIDTARLAGLDIDRWNAPVAFSAMPGHAATAGGEIVFDLPVLDPAGDANRGAVEFIVHGMPDNPDGGVDNKDGWNANIRVGYGALAIADGVGHVWLTQGLARVDSSPPEPRRVSTLDARAVWLSRDLLQWPRSDDTGTFRLYHAARAGIVVQRGAAVTGADGAIRLHAGASVPTEIAGRFRHLDPGVVLSVDADDRAALDTALHGQLVLVQEDADGRVLGATTPQIAGLLDDRFAAAGQVTDLGARIERGHARFKLWAPTAQAVALCVYAPRGGSRAERAMRMDPATGVWEAALPGRHDGRYYAYAVQTFVRGVGVVRNLVTDPYSISLDADSRRSYLADLDSPALMPPGWQRMRAPRPLRAQEDMTIYELHVRDFSIGDTSVSPRHRGKYLAFAEPGSDGMRHLRALARAGLTDVHLLPVFDIASVPERDCATPTIPQAAPDSDAQQAAIEPLRARDCFNWGYDPWHYTAPEGSYATDPDDGAARIREFRAMVLALNDAGLRVGMDVVYNHTSASGQAAHSVLDRIVPGYYHRLDATGAVERSTCCENTATEHRMMGKLMIDSVKTWATQYRIASFRFDLMGHQPREVMERLRDDVNAAVGHPVQLIGEGWNFGEVANGARFVQASQLSLNGSGIGTFSDRARDHVRGGSGFDSGPALRRNQGYINGLYYDDNGYDDNGTGGGKTRTDLMWSADLIKVGLAGSLRDYPLTTHWDATLPLAQIDYNGQPAGYVTDPQEVVNYVENHDNQTLFDVNAYKLPTTTSREDRARVQILGLAINSFSQGVAYFHAGGDILRSKSMDRNSFDSGDWFNRLDWRYRDNGFGAGLPPRADNGEQWPVIGPLLANADIKPTPTDIAWTRDAFRDLLRIRASSRLFRMRTGEEIRQRLTFHNTGSGQVPTVLVAHLDGRGYPDAGFRDVVYFVNVDTVAREVVLAPERGKSYRLHPVHTAADAADRRAGAARYDAATGAFSIPARTAVVFVTR